MDALGNLEFVQSFFLGWGLQFGLWGAFVFLQIERYYMLFLLLAIGVRSVFANLNLRDTWYWILRLIRDRLWLDQRRFFGLFLLVEAYFDLERLMSILTNCICVIMGRGIYIWGGNIPWRFWRYSHDCFLRFWIISAWLIDKNNFGLFCFYITKGVGHFVFLGCLVNQIKFVLSLRSFRRL